MDGPRDHHTKWSKPEKDRYYIISLICRIEHKWTYLQNRSRLSDIVNKQTCNCQELGWVGEGKIVSLDYQMQIITHRMNRQEGNIV